MITWPENKSFAFTIVDDTDHSFIENIKPVYDLLYSYGMLTTKTVWVYPSRDNFSGQTLEDPKYLEFVKDLHSKGFEIAFHNVGSGTFKRHEIIDGLELFKELIGHYPLIHINHAHNPDNIYWGYKRYGKILAPLFKLLYQDKRTFFGDDQTTEFFWGDYCKKHIKYIRNYSFNGINTLKYDPKMPYQVSSKMDYSNYWFSSSDAQRVDNFNQLITRENVDKLEKEGGLCIAYTHFAKGFVDKAGVVDKAFSNNIKYLSERNGWFVPASQILDFLLSLNKGSSVAIPPYLNKLDFIWLKERLAKRIKTNR